MNSELARFSREIDRLNLMPLWERTTPMRPGSPCVPMLWRYAELRPLLMRAAELITARSAELARWSRVVAAAGIKAD